MAVRHATLDIHGAPILKVKSQILNTAQVGATQITLVEKVDWKVGDEIAIASTDFDGFHAEQRTITSIANSSTTTTISFTKPLEFIHESIEETLVDDSKIFMRAEVGLLTRSVVF